MPGPSQRISLPPELVIEVIIQLAWIEAKPTITTLTCNIWLDWLHVVIGKTAPKPLRGPCKLKHILSLIYWDEDPLVCVKTSRSDPSSRNISLFLRCIVDK